ncbi:SRPBCC domain-containing protein [Microbacter sp. GSS18]|nr:SRPBCC domain-containing protein [Microbacter sp. GSS18]
MFELTHEVEVAAPLDVVWHDWTNAASLEEWFWPASLEAAAHIMPEPTGAWLIRSVPASMAVVATIVSLDAPHVMRLQWSWEGEEGHVTEVEVSLDAVEGGETRVRVVHAGLLSDDEVDSHRQGWADCLDRLVQRHQ